ncbi:hypothetical protein [Streptomyces sp. NBC_01171]|uniref:hypothetical protein n=1 Tax=Streptomyces sp. NBC_01171 TaxID=2903757 RepID=UPI003869DF3E|nr:hypothetical protein OG448_09280 [Streptomyces sp. NBC_01171]
MDPELAALAATAGTTLVSSLTTEVWQRARDGIASLWRRSQPERADAITTELDTTRVDLMAARDGGDGGTPEELGAEWQGRIRRLLVAHPETADDLRSLLAELTPAAAVTPSVTQHATASGQARVYQAGRDQNFTER